MRVSQDCAATGEPPIYEPFTQADVVESLEQVVSLRSRLEATFTAIGENFRLVEFFYREHRWYETTIGLPAFNDAHWSWLKEGASKRYGSAALAASGEDTDPVFRFRK